MSVAVGNGRHRGELKPIRGGSRGGRDSSRSTKAKLDKSGSVRDLEPEVSKSADELGYQSRPRKYQPKSAVPIQKYSAEEIDAVGPLVLDPASLGFVKRIHRPRPVPKYMLSQPRLLKTPKFVQNEWDRENQLAMCRLESTMAGSDYQGLYEKLQVMREQERSQMERLGLVDAENATKTLNDAIVFSGTCCEMCPVFERARRALENNVMALERDPETNRVSPSRAVKAFSRPAAGQAPPMPSEVRPPHILVQTLDYLIDEILPKLPLAHSFLWDRTRSIRQDFTYQNFYGPEAIDCNERIVRVHLLSLHVMAGSDMEYLQQQELEQLNKALQTLLEIYEDVRHHGGQCPNEAEFRAYHLLSHFRDPEILHDLQRLPRSVFVDSRLQLALRLVALCSQNNLNGRTHANSPGALNMYSEFFRTVYSSECPFLMSCILETQFNEIRFYALKSMARSFHTRGKPYPNTLLQHLLGFLLLDDSLKFVLYYEIDVIHEQGALFIDLFNKEKLATKYKLNLISEKPRFSQPYSAQLDKKIEGLSYRDIVNSGAVNGPLNLETPQILDVKIEASYPYPDKPVATAPIFSQNLSTFQKTDGMEHSTASKSNVAFGARPPTTNKSIFPPSKTPLSSMSIPNTFGSLNSQKKIPSSALNQSFGLSSTLKPAGSSLRSPVNSLSLGEVSNNELTNSNLFPRIPSTGKKPPLNLLNSQSSQIPGPPAVSKRPQSTNDSNVPPKLGLSFAFTKPFNVNKTGAIFQPSAQDENLGLVDTQAEITTKPVEEVIPVAAPSITIPESKKLVDHPRFKEAALQVYQSILEMSVESELSKALPKLIEAVEREAARLRAIDSLANGLYVAFINEASHSQVMESAADSYRSKTTKRKFSRFICKVSKLCMDKANQKQRKLAELGEFAVPSTKSNQSEGGIPPLWAPLDIEKFAAICLRQIYSPKTLRFLLVVQDWSRPLSKWLNTKLGLNLSRDGSRYQRLVRRGQLTLEIESWGGGSVRDAFGNAAFIAVECGVVPGADAAKLDETLERDRRVLAKLVQLLERYGRYHSHIMVMYWDVTGSRRSPKDIEKSLGIEQCRTSTSVDKIHFVDMSLGDALESLDSGFAAMSAGFTFALSKRGIKVSQSLERKTLMNNLEKRENEAILYHPKRDADTMQTNYKSENIADTTQSNSNSRSTERGKDHPINPSSGMSLDTPQLLNSRQSTPEPGPNTNANTLKRSTSPSFASSQSPTKRAKQYLYLQKYQSNRRIGLRDWSPLTKSPGSSRGDYTNNMTTMNASVLAGYGRGLTLGSNSRRDTSEPPIPQQERELHDMAQAIKAKYAGV